MVKFSCREITIFYSTNLLCQIWSLHLSKEAAIRWPSWMIWPSEVVGYFINRIWCLMHLYDVCPGYIESLKFKLLNAYWNLTSFSFARLSFLMKMKSVKDKLGKFPPLPYFPWRLLSYSLQSLKLAILMPTGCERLFSAFLLGWGSSSACADTVTPNGPFPTWSTLANIPPPSSWWHLQPFTALTKVRMIGPISSQQTTTFLGPVCL